MNANDSTIHDQKLQLSAMISEISRLELHELRSQCQVNGIDTDHKSREVMECALLHHMLDQSFSPSIDNSSEDEIQHHLRTPIPKQKQIRTTKHYSTLKKSKIVRKTRKWNWKKLFLLPKPLPITGLLSDPTRLAAALTILEAVLWWNSAIPWVEKNVDLARISFGIPPISFTFSWPQFSILLQIATWHTWSLWMTLTMIIPLLVAVMMTEGNKQDLIRTFAVVRLVQVFILQGAGLDVWNACDALVWLQLATSSLVLYATERQHIKNSILIAPQSSDDIEE